METIDTQQSAEMLEASATLTRNLVFMAEVDYVYATLHDLIVNVRKALQSGLIDEEAGFIDVLNEGIRSNAQYYSGLIDFDLRTKSGADYIANLPSTVKEQETPTVENVPNLRMPELLSGEYVNWRQKVEQYFQDVVARDAEALLSKIDYIARRQRIAEQAAEFMLPNGDNIVVDGQFDLAREINLLINGTELQLSVILSKRRSDGSIYFSGCPSRALSRSEIACSDEQNLLTMFESAKEVFESAIKRKSAYGKNIGRRETSESVELEIFGQKVLLSDEFSHAVDIYGDLPYYEFEIASFGAPSLQAVRDAFWDNPEQFFVYIMEGLLRIWEVSMEASLSEETVESRVFEV
ncbi:hypothetical protein JKY72_00935 [Candidatus Gracilibacteria bacterium]|nr:hypothetical protein [Candidatus Gracilibacteria bacterium]